MSISQPWEGTRKWSIGNIKWAKEVFYKDSPVSTLHGNRCIYRILANRITEKIVWASLA